MKGLGFLIYIINNLNLQDVLQALKRVKASWVSFKVADYDRPYNQVGGNDTVLRDGFIRPLQDAGYEVGGWHFIYPGSPDRQANRASERVQTLGLSHLLVDAEGHWKRTDVADDATIYMSWLKVPSGFPVGLCSYRFPTQHNPFPFRDFLNHAKMTFNAPQVYWAGRHDPVEQLARSELEYDQLTPKAFVPIGSTFGETFSLSDGTKFYWEPTEADLAAFTQAAKKYPAYGFYSLDWLLNHNRTGWLDAIAGGVVVEPPPPAPTGMIEITVDNTNFRNAPEIVSSTDAGNLHRGGRLKRIGETDDGKWVKVEGYVWKDNTREV